MVELSYTIHLCDKYLYSREGCFFMSEGLLTDKQTEEVIRFLKEKTLTKAFKLGLNSDRKPSIFDSKVGGIPYFPSNMDIPKNSEGYSLTLLAQLNMADFEGSDCTALKFQNCKMRELNIAGATGIEIAGDSDDKKFRPVFKICNDSIKIADCSNNE